MLHDIIQNHFLECVKGTGIATASPPVNNDPHLATLVPTNELHIANGPIGEGFSYI
jgi:hypothetical protein